ncbi:MAG: AI-2E family transporter [Bacteroidota bacterium]
MARNTKYLFIILGALFIMTILWYFQNIVAYIIIAGVISLIGRPLVDFLRTIKYKNIQLPKGVCALLTLFLLWGLLFLFLRIFIPLIATEANQLAEVNFTPLLKELENPTRKIEKFFHQVRPGLREVSFQEYLTEKLASFINPTLITSIFGSLAGILGNIFIAVFSISFIAFFFLKDEQMLGNGIILLVPPKVENEARHGLRVIKRLLTRYFIGIMIQVTGIIILVTIGLKIVGISFQHSLTIALFVGIMNVIPYLGPLIGGLAGLLIGLAIHIELPLYNELLPLMGYMTLVFISVQLIDNFIFQPLIYSNSVNAHPLEIFLVILIAGSLAGIPGMVLAIPAYTVLRVFLKEFLYNSKIVKKLTEKI